jgi:hypothetical protein
MGNSVTHIVLCTTGGTDHFAERGVRYLNLRFEDEEHVELKSYINGEQYCRSM